jgi:hypothetical protein
VPHVPNVPDKAFCLLASEALRRYRIRFVAWELPLMQDFVPGMLCVRYFSYAIVLREPLARIASWIRFDRFLDNHQMKPRELPHLLNQQLNSSAASASTPARWKLKKNEIANFDNVYIRSLLGRTGTYSKRWKDFGQVSPAALDSAKRMLMHFRLVLVLEDLSEPHSISLLQQFGLKAPASGVVSRNVNLNVDRAQRNTYHPLSPAAVEMLRTLNQPDMKLYSAARALAKVRAGATMPARHRARNI